MVFLTMILLAAAVFAPILDRQVERGLHSADFHKQGGTP
ncbi:hypothetical protein CTS44_02260 [Comamonas thiooxydans]|nr:hypothetical protein CTS44_02260 [Comamonas thiooxydans]